MYSLRAKVGTINNYAETMYVKQVCLWPGILVTLKQLNWSLPP